MYHVVVDVVVVDDVGVVNKNVVVVDVDVVVVVEIKLLLLLLLAVVEYVVDELCVVELLVPVEVAETELIANVAEDVCVDSFHACPILQHLLLTAKHLVPF